MDCSSASIIPNTDETRCAIWETRKKRRKKKKMWGGWLLCDGTLGRKLRTHPETEGKRKISQSPNIHSVAANLLQKKKKKGKNKRRGEKTPHGNGNARGPQSCCPWWWHFFSSLANKQGALACPSSSSSSDFFSEKHAKNVHFIMG